MTLILGVKSYLHVASELHSLFHLPLRQILQRCTHKGSIGFPAPDDSQTVQQFISYVQKQSGERREFAAL